MATDESVYRKRRIGALVVLAALVAAIWGVPQLFANTGQEVLPTPEVTQTEEAAPAELTNCAPGVVSVEVMIGKLISSDGDSQVVETFNSFAPETNPDIWYEITNNGLVDCKFNVGSRVTFFTITSGEQTYWSSRDCDRSNDTDRYVTLPSNSAEEAAASPWEKSYSSENGCSASANDLVPTGGATYKIKVEVNGVISEEKRFILN
ncbi:MAG: hypothetical protein DCO81_04575 [Candidatus Aquiluna sp. XM-24bin5]|nr:MAG: hypothetical protein DCO81_04575 [Candidatus Aquiluna sp. XM-24bin5]